jgi:polysaccharide biosynthesis transport protein
MPASMRVHDRPPGSPYPAPGHPQGFKDQLERAFDILYRGKWIILICTLVALAAAVWYSYPVVPRYEAHSFIMVDLAATAAGGGRTSEAQGLYPENENLFSQSNRTVSDELLVLRISSPLKQRVAERLLEARTTPLSGQSIHIASVGGRQLTPGQVAARLTSQVRFDPERGSLNIVRITAISAYPEEAALIANLFAQEYEAMTQEAGSERYVLARSFLEQQERERLAELRSIEARMNTYVAQVGTGGISEDGRQMAIQIANLEVDRDQRGLELQMKRANLNNIEQEIARLEPEAAQRIASDQESIIQELQDKRATLLEQKEQTETLTPSTAEIAQMNQQRVRELEDQIRLIDADIARRAQQVVGGAGLSGGGTGALARLATLQQQADTERREIQTLEGQMRLLEDRLLVLRQEYQLIPGHSMTIAELERQREYARDMYEYVSQRLLDMRIAGAPEQGAGYVQVVQQAYVPGAPLPSTALRNMILGAFLGLMLGLALTLGREVVDNSIRKPDQLRAHGYYEIGIVPNMRGLIRKEYGGKDFIEHKGRNVSTSLVALHDPLSPIAEAYRPVRMNLLTNLSKEQGQSILITSSGSGEGKSVTAANLAVVMAEAGKRTLLVDADLRRPQVHKYFGVKSDVTLLQLLREERTFEAEDAASGVDNLYVLTAGGTTHHSAELLGSPRMRILLEELRQQFDVMIIDTPPVMAVTDAALLASRCDATIVVTRAGKTKEKELEFTMEVLERAGARIAGTMLNAFDLSNAFGYKYRYRAYDKYGPYSNYSYS